MKSEQCFIAQFNRAYKGESRVSPPLPVVKIACLLLIDLPLVCGIPDKCEKHVETISVHLPSYPSEEICESGARLR